MFPFILHVIPVGGTEPDHLAHGATCWCQPLETEQGRLMTHHAKDGRERFERQGMIRYDLKWVVVEEETEAS